MKFKVDETWVILNPIEKDIKEKIDYLGTPLSKWDIRIYRGILTGYNEAFLINKSQKENLISIDPRSAEIIRPVLRGRDVKRYKCEFANIYIISTFPSLSINIDDFPAIKNHLLSYGFHRLEQTGLDFFENGTKLSARKKTNNRWFETQDNIAYWEEFLKQKIVFSEIVQSPQFYLDDYKYFVEATAFILTGIKLPFLTVMLNSKLYAYVFKKFYSGGGLGEQGFRYKKLFLLKLPILLPEWSVERKIEEYLYTLKNLQGKNLDKTMEELEEITMEIHNLSEKEKAIIRNTVF